MQANNGSIASRLVSFLLWIGAIFRGTPPQQSPAVAAAPVNFNPDPDYASTLEDVPRYPPFDRGLPAIPIERVLDTQRALFERIKSSDLPYVEEAVRNLAAYVHLLPATTNDVFSGAGGLLRLCLETGFHSYVASQGNIFTARDPAERRRELEPKWQLAAFLSGLCCELGRAINTSVVTNDRGEQWLPFEPLTVWLVRTDSRRYFLRPPQTVSSQLTDPAHLSGIIVNSIIPAAALQHITTDDRSILMEMLAAISRISDTFHSGHFARTVRHIRDQVMARDQKSNPRSFGTPLVGMHVEPYLINAMRHLIKNGTWKRNEKLARVHLSNDGCFLFWTTGVPEILELLRQEGALGIPTDPRTLGELLIQSGVFEKNPNSTLWWYIRPPGASVPYEVVKLSNPGIILEEEVIASTAIYPCDIIVSPPASASQAFAAPVPPTSTRSPADHSSTTPSPSSPSTPPVARPSDAPSPGTSTGDANPPIDASPSSPPAVSPSSGFNRALEVVAGAPSNPQQASTAAPHRPDGQPPTSGPKILPTKPKPARNQPSSSSKVSEPSPAPTPSPNLPSASADSDAEPSAPPQQEEQVSDRVKRLRPSTLGLLKTIADWHNDPASNRKSLWQSDGLAIPVSLIQEAGGERGELLTSLKAIKVVMFAGGKSSVMHQINNVLHFKITPEAAHQFGFEGKVTSP
jgi:conjugal transfer pilus assembly protein TraI